MGELANYSIETDQIVLLAFRDGRRLRVHVSRLPHYLSAPDLEKVRAALRLRRDFINKHMPKTALILAAGAALALLAVSGKIVATVMQHPVPPAPDPGHTAIVRSQPLPEPSMTPSATPSVQGDATVAVASPSPQPAAKHSTKAKAQPKIAAPHAAVAAKVAVSLPLLSAPPSPSPAPSVSPQPSPTPSPAPIADGSGTGSQPTPSPIPNQGEVLGDSTGPGSP